MSSIPDAHDVRQHADNLFTPATDLAPDSSPAMPFTEAQARAWLDANGQQSIRLMAKLWGWHPSKVQRFLRRARPDTAPSVSADSDTAPDTPDWPRHFDYNRSEVILPMRSSVNAYIDPETGELWISASDPERRSDDEIRIDADDVESFLLGLNDLWRKSRGRP
jgi:hypothetical protein